jgi:hypothetical protein
MFGNNAVPPPRLLSYGSALKHYNSVVPIRGRSTDVRPASSNRKNDSLLITKCDKTGDISIRLYGTDIITYSAEGDGEMNEIRLQPYSTRLTDHVVCNVLSPHVFAHYCSPVGSVVEVGGRFYNMKDEVVIKPAQRGWTLLSGSKPFIKFKLNRAEAKDALERYKFKEFSLWCRTQLRLGLDVRQQHNRYHSRFYGLTHVNKMAFEHEWLNLIREMTANYDISHELGILRQSVYVKDQCYDATTVDCVTSHSELRNIARSCKVALG